MFFRFLTYNKFKKRKWKRLTPEKRAQVYQQLENIQAKKQKRDACRVVFREMEETSNGVHISAENKIQLNSKFVYRPEFRYYGMATLFHEGRHAFQYHAITTKKKLGFFSKARKWKKNFQGYTSSDQDAYSFYSMQPVERDANLYAIRRMRRFRFRYRNDKLFANTLKDKEAQFDEVKNLAKRELGLFYGIRVALKNRKNRKKKGYD